MARLGGRNKGVPNKITTQVRAIITKITTEYYTSPDFMSDIQLLEPKDRLQIMEKLVAYVIPRMQSTSIALSEESNSGIEEALIKLAQKD